MIRRLVIAVAAIVLVVIVIVVAAPFLIPASLIKSQAESRLSDILGREFRIDGELTLRRWPPLRLQATDVRLANAPWAGSEQMATIAAVDVDADLLALLSRRVVLDRLVLDQPVINLATDADGKGNWQFGDKASTQDDDAGDADGGAEQVGDLPEIRIGEIAVNGGTFTLADGVSGETRTFEQISLSLGQSEGSDAMVIDASVTSDGETASLNGSIEDANALIAGGQSPLTLNATIPAGSIGLDGSIDAGSRSLAINSTVQIADLRHLADWAGAPIGMPAGALETLDLQANIEGSENQLDIKGLQINLDDLAVSGELQIVNAARPKISGSLDLGDLDLEPYMPPESAAETGDDGSSSAGADQGWPDEPLDLPLPLPVDLDLALAMNSLKAANIELGAGKLAVAADESTTGAEVEELALYDGTLVASASLSSQQPHDIALDLDAKALDALGLLKGAADFGRLDGTASLKTSLTSSGASVKQIIEALNGSGTVTFRDGAIIGINIAAILRRISTLGVGSLSREPERTDFAELGGSYTIENGVLNNQDLALRAPALRVTGSGSVDLPKQSLDYQVVPQLAATIEGQDASSDPSFAAGFPVSITGPWADPSIQLEIGDLVTGNLLDPGGVANALEDIASHPEVLGEFGDALGLGAGDVDKLLGDILPGGLKGGSGDSDVPVESIIKGLGGILNRGK